LRNFPIPLPQLSEQKRIVEQLDSLSQKVRQLEEIYTKQIANCDELKQSFLKKAFEGEL
jgi:type I restriction enzyme S subunit